MKFTVLRCALLAALLVPLLAPAASARDTDAGWLKFGVSGQVYSWQTGTC